MFSSDDLAFTRQGQSEHYFFPRQDIALFRRPDRQPITLKFEEPNLVLRIMDLVPGHIDFGNPGSPLKLQHCNTPLAKISPKLGLSVAPCNYMPRIWALVVHAGGWECVVLL